MKKSFMLMLAVLTLSVSSCRVDFGGGISNRLEPSENIVKAKYPQPSFDRVENHAFGHIRLVQSNQSRVTLSAPENYVDLFDFKNVNGSLEIRFTKKGVNIDARNVTIIVYTPTLREVKNSGLADVYFDSLTTDDLVIRNSGAGSFSLSEINAKRVDVTCSGAGSISLNGQAEKGEYLCSGVGSIDAKGMKASVVDAKVSGVGSIECYATDFIKGRVTGIGSLRYGGRPADRDLNRSGIGGISEM